MEAGKDSEPKGPALTQMFTGSLGLRWEQTGGQEDQGDQEEAATESR